MDTPLLDAIRSVSTREWIALGEAALRIAVIVVAAWLAVKLARRAIRASVVRLSDGAGEDRHERLETLGRVIAQGVSGLVWLVAAMAILDALGVAESDRIKPVVVSSQIIRHVDAHQVQLVNRMRYGHMLLAGQTLYVLEVEPAGYAALAANEAEKAAHINILDVRAFGSFGRVYLGGEERDIMAGYGAAVSAIESVAGRSVETKRRT